MFLCAVVHIVCIVMLNAWLPHPNCVTCQPCTFYLSPPPPRPFLALSFFKHEYVGWILVILVLWILVIGQLWELKLYYKMCAQCIGCSHKYLCAVLCRLRVPGTKKKLVINSVRIRGTKTIGIMVFSFCCWMPDHRNAVIRLIEHVSSQHFSVHLYAAVIIFKA